MTFRREQLSDDVTLYQGDCLEVLASQEPGSIDAVVMDPPYCAGAVSEAQRTRAAGQGLRSENLRRFGWFVGDNMGTAGLAWLLRSVAVGAMQICRPTGSLLTFCDWRMVSSLQPAIEAAGLRYQNLVVWDKEHMGLGSGFRCQHELILHFTFGCPEYHDRGTPNVLRCRRVPKDEREHQTQKPVALLERLIRLSCPRGGVVLDPFSGSGATGVAALRSGRKFVGVERDPGYFDVACRRIATEIQARQSQPEGVTA